MKIKNQHQEIFVGFLLFLAVGLLLLIYHEGLFAKSYIIDDQSLINIPQLQDGRFFSFVFNVFRFYSYHIDYYPIRDISYWIDIHLLGAQVTSSLLIFRLHNFAIFYVIGILFHAILCELKINSWPNIMLLILWMLHPYHVEALMWVTARKDLLALCFTFIFFLFFLKTRQKMTIANTTIMILSVLFCGLSKNIISPVAILLATFGLFESRGRIDFIKRTMVHSTVLLMSLGFLFWTRYFYSNINDMRLAYTPSYRIQASLAALGRMIFGWINPNVNAIDVFNWGDWAYRNQKYFIISCIAIGAFIWILHLGYRNRDRITWAFILLFIATYVPVSGLVFPHRNFYSVRYFELPSLVLWLFLMYKLQKFKHSYFSSKKYLNNIFCLILSCLMVGVVTFQYFEAKNWISPLATVEKALALDMDNPSLLAEKRLLVGGMPFNASCEKKLHESSIGPNGDLCWFEIVSRSSSDSQIQRSHEDWLILHAKNHSPHFLNLTKTLYQWTRLLREDRSMIEGRSMISDLALPAGFLNTGWYRALYLAGLCKMGRNSELESMKTLFLENHLIKSKYLRNFAASFSKLTSEQLETCFPASIRESFSNTNWNDIAERSKGKNFFQWWLKSIKEGAPGNRNGCGSKSIHGYDCGSTMDQASMINLYAELFHKTKEEGFLSEAFRFAKNGNQMCSIDVNLARPCGDGKAQGTWLLSLLKLFLDTSDLTLRTHLIMQLNVKVDQLTINDIWDVYELYRSYFLGFMILPEARQLNFFNELRSVGISKKIITLNQIDEIHQTLECFYKKKCSVNNVSGTISQSQVVSSLRELGMAKESQVNTFPLPFSRWIISQCELAPDKGRNSLPTFLKDFKENKFNDNKKSFDYTQEGDNFSPVMLATFNHLFREDFGCGHWEMINYTISPLFRFFRFDLENKYPVKRRPVFVLSQLRGKKVRIWVVNNTKDLVTLKALPNCIGLIVPEIKIKPFSEGEFFISLNEKFNGANFGHCELIDNLARSYPL